MCAQKYKQAYRIDADRRRAMNKKSDNSSLKQGTRNSTPQTEPVVHQLLWLAHFRPGVVRIFVWWATTFSV